MNLSIFSSFRNAYKPLLFVAVAFALPWVSLAQTTISVAPIKMNVLYIGPDNPVSVAVAGSADDKVTVTITGGGASISKIDAGLYNVKVTTQTDDCILNVFVDGKPAGSTRFRVRKMPLPSAAIGGYTSGSKLTPEALRSQAGLSVFITNFPFEIKYEITAFTVVLSDSKGNLIRIPCQGAEFSAAAKHNIQQHASSGGIVTIEEILARADGGKEFKLPSLLYEPNSHQLAKMNSSVQA